MVSAKIKARRASDSAQLTLQFAPGLVQRYGSLRECIAACIYKRGLSNVAPSLNKAPGNLSVELSEDPVRKFGVDTFEEYLDKFGDDLTPVLYLVEKYLSDRAPQADAALQQIPDLMLQLVSEMKRAGLSK